MTDDSRALMQRYCAGDAGAFRALYQAIAPRLLGYLVKLARDRSVAEDLLQQTFWKVHRARAAYVVGADPVPWIGCVLLALAAMMLVEAYLALRGKKAPPVQGMPATAMSATGS